MCFRVPLVCVKNSAIVPLRPFSGTSVFAAIQQNAPYRPLSGPVPAVLRVVFFSFLLSSSAIEAGTYANGCLLSLHTGHDTVG